MKSSRLKNFCELCRKQCRDQNGYICHLNSVAHQRRVQQYKTNPQQHIQKYSLQLQYKFINLLKRKYPGQPKYLQSFYQEYTQEKRVIKFNQTKWKNLNQFAQHLKTSKNIKITGNNQSYYITYTVNKTMDFIQKNKKQQLQALKQKQKQIFEKSLINKIQRQKANQQRQIKLFNQQVKKNQKQRQNIIIPDKLQFNFDNFTQNNKRNAFVTVQDLQKQSKNQTQQTQNKHKTNKLINNQILINKMINNDQRKQANKNNKQKDTDQPEWIIPNIIVKIKPHQIDDVFHNKKTKIISIVQPYVAKIQIGTATLQIDQTYLQTVIPKIGNQVIILQGTQKGKIGILKQVNLLGGFGKILLSSIIQIPFNYFSKFQSQ